MNSIHEDRDAFLLKIEFVPSHGSESMKSWNQPGLAAR